MAKVSQHAKIVQRAHRTLDIEAKAVQEQKKNVNENFVRAVQLIARCLGRVVVMGIGKSGIIARKIAATLSSTGTSSYFLHPTEGMHGDIGMMRKDDVILALSHSGQTDEIRRLLPLIARMGLPLIAVTARRHSDLAKAADLVISLSVSTEACPYNISPTASSTAMLAMGDALSLAVMELKGFKKEDYAHLHPGGVLGKRLLLTVGDIMHKGKSNPVIRQDAEVQKALFIMTKTRLGAVNVIDQRGRLVGFFTDGDLRRSLQQKNGILKEPLRKVMTKHPVTIAPHRLAFEAASLIKKHHFDNIPVVDEAGRPVGVVDERDLLAEGIV